MSKKLDAQVIQIFGRRGTGKTTRIRELIEKRRRVLVLSTRPEFQNQVAWDDLAGVVSQKSFLAAYTPPEGLAIEAGDKIARALMRNTGSLITLVVDECQAFAPAQGLPRDQRGLIVAAQEGRHANLELIVATQRPATMAIDLRGNAEVSYIFGLSWATDVDVVCQMVGREHRERILALEDHEFIRFEKGQLTQGRNAAKF